VLIVVSGIERSQLSQLIEVSLSDEEIYWHFLLEFVSDATSGNQASNRGNVFSLLLIIINI
jgi:hypothetical protein